MQDRPVITDDPDLAVEDLNSVEVFLKRGLFRKGGGVSRKNRRDQTKDQPARQEKTKRMNLIEARGLRKERAIVLFARYSMDPPRMILCKVARLNMVAE